MRNALIPALRRRFLFTVGAGVIAAAAWAGSAAAGPVERTVTFEATYTFTNPEFCGDAIMIEHDVGRITFAVFLNRDGTLQMVTLHDAAVTSTFTNTQTGETLTSFYTNFLLDQYRTDPRSGTITNTFSVSGLNFIIGTAEGAPLVSAGRVVATFTVTFDADGNPIFTFTGGGLTPNLRHLTEVFCG